MDKNVSNSSFLPEDFLPAKARESDLYSVNYTDDSFVKDVLRRFWKNKGSVIGMVFIFLVILLASISPLLSSHTYQSQIIEHATLPPRIPGLEKLGIFNGCSDGVNLYAKRGLTDIYYFFGTDTLGRDLWVRTWFGTRISLYMAAVAMFCDMIIGITYGLVSGYFGGRVDLVMQRFIEILNGIPNMIIVTLLVLVLKPGLLSITLALLITGWIGMSRVARAQMLKLKEQEFVLASKTLGTSNRNLIFREILPNIFGQVIIMSMFSIPNAIFTEAFLAFIGLGLQAPLASLGVLINDGFQSLIVMPFMVIIPTLVLAVLMLSFNIVADGLRDAFDPKMKEM